MLRGRNFGHLATVMGDEYAQVRRPGMERVLVRIEPTWANEVT